MTKKIKAAEVSADFRLGVARLQQDTREAARALKSIETSAKDLGNVFKTIAGISFAAVAINEIGRLNSAFAELAEKGDAASDIADNFKALGGSASSIDEARKALLGTVSAFDLMKVANQGLLRDIPGLNQNLSQIADFSKRYAETTKQDVLPVLEGFTDALAKGKTKGLEPYGFVLDKTATKAQNQAAVFAQLQARIDSMAAPTDSVAEAQAALAVSMDDVLIKFGMGVNSSGELTSALRNLSEEIEKSDFKDLGKDLAELYSILVNMASIALPPLISGFGKLASAIGYFTQSTNEGVIAGFQERLSAVNKQLKQIDDDRKGGIVFFDEKAIDEQKARLDKEAANLQQNINNLNKIRADQFGREEKLAQESAEKTAKARKEIEDRRHETELAAEKNAAAKKAKSALDAFDKAVQNFETKSLTDKLNDAIKLGDGGAFSTSLDAYKNQIYDSIIEAHKDAYSTGGEVARKIEEFAKSTSDFEAEQYVQKMAEAESKRADDIRKKSLEAHTDSVQVWQSLFENAITGVTFDLESALKQVAVGFAAEMAHAIIGSLSGLNFNSAQGLGGAIAQSILGGVSGGGGGGLLGGGLLETIGLTGAGGLLGSFGTTAAAADAAGLAGPAMANGMFSSGSGLLGSIGPALPYVAVAAVAAGVIHENWGSIEKFFGGGSQNKETNARNEFAGKLEDMIDKIGGLTIFNSNNQMERITDIKVGANDRFNDPGWADNFQQLDKSAQGVFNALGEGLKGVLGITEDVGGQMALVLSENFGGSVDNARLAVQQLGLTFEDFQKVFLEQAEQGVIRWSEYNVQIAGIAEAFKPGLVAVGATKQAYDQLVNSGGRGLASVAALKNAAVEGLEVGLTTIAQLGDRLTAEGASPEIVQALIDSATQRGISKLEELKGSSNEVVGGIVGGMEALSTALTDKWSQMEAQIDSLNSKLETIPDEISTRIKVEAEIDPRISDLLENGNLDLSGGSVPTTAALTNAGDSGLDSLTTRRRSAVSVRGLRTASAGLGGNQIVVNVDARGADAGVEHKIIAAMQGMKEEFAGYAMEVITDSRRRGY